MSVPTVRILLVEDSADDAKLLAHVLDRAGMPAHIQRVDNKVALRDALQATSWDVVLSDWSLPGWTGLEALQQVRASGLDVPFIIVSGSVGEELAVDAMRAGAHDYVLKDRLTRLVPAIEREMRDHEMRRDHRNQEQRFRALIEKSVEAVILHNAEGKVTYASPASTSLAGRTPEEMVGLHLIELVYPEDRARVGETMKRVRSQPESESGECRIIRPTDGALRWIAWTATNMLDDKAVRSVVVNLRDVTDRRHAADALHQSEIRFKRLSESGIVGIMTSDLHGNILDANDTYLNVIGYTREELAAGEVRWADLTPPDLRESQAALAPILAANGVIKPWETAVIRKDGVRVPLLCGVAMMEYPICIAFCADLTERKRTEAALRTSEEHLRQAQKMEAVGRLAGGVAHDFNNVLSVVLSYAEMLLADLVPGDPRRDDLVEIFHAGRRAADLTRQLLMFSRQQVVEPKILDLNQVTQNMDKMFRRVLGEDIELVTRPAPRLGTVHADPSSIEQVIMNLVVNARDAMPTGGKLTIETDNVILDEDYAKRHGGVTPGAYVMLAVSDTGHGMDRETQAHIFEPFYTTKETDKGTGLGLSTVFGIVQQAGGSVWVYSELQRGSTFKVYLPCVVGSIDTARPASASFERGNETVLLVEDEAQVRNVARGILVRSGYTVLEASTPSEAIARCAQHEGEIHMMLTDVVMPQMGGPELAKRLAPVRPRMRLLCMSGYTDDSIVRHGILSSNIAFLQKPFTPQTLSAKVREVLDSYARALPAPDDIVD